MRTLVAMTSTSTVAVGSGIFSHVIEIAIVVTNLLVFLATVLLVRVTAKEANETAREVIREEGKSRRMMMRLLRTTRTNTNVKHRRA